MIHGRCRPSERHQGCLSSRRVVWFAIAYAGDIFFHAKVCTPNVPRSSTARLLKCGTLTDALVLLNYIV